MNNKPPDKPPDVHAKNTRNSGIDPNEHLQLPTCMAEPAPGSINDKLPSPNGSQMRNDIVGISAVNSSEELEGKDETLIHSTLANPDVHALSDDDDEEDFTPVETKSSRRTHWEFLKLTITKPDGSFPSETEFLDYDVVEIAIHNLGIPVYELSHVSSEMGPGKALIGVKQPIDILKKFAKLELPFNYKNTFSGDEFIVDIKGLRKTIDLHATKTFRVKALRTVGRVPTSEIAKSLSLFTDSVKEAGYVRSDANKGSLDMHPALKSLNVTLGSGSVAFDVIGEPSSLPTLLPVKGQIVKLEFMRMRKQCSLCFKFKHTRTNCKNAQVGVKDYQNHLLSSLKEAGKIESNIKSYSEANKPSRGVEEVFPKLEQKTTDGSTSNSRSVTPTLSPLCPESDGVNTKIHSVPPENPEVAPNLGDISESENAPSPRLKNKTQQLTDDISNIQASGYHKRPLSPESVIASSSKGGQTTKFSKVANISSPNSCQRARLSSRGKSPAISIEAGRAASESRTSILPSINDVLMNPPKGRGSPSGRKSNR